MLSFYDNHYLCLRSDHLKNISTCRLILTVVTLLILINDPIHHTSASSVTLVRPSTGRATLTPGQPLHMECKKAGEKRTDFKWFRRSLDNETEVELEPTDDDIIQIHNERLTLVKPYYNMAGDYFCRALNQSGQADANESQMIKVRTMPFIRDFDEKLSHTGGSVTKIEGERLELDCSVPSEYGKVKITWLRSQDADDEKSMTPISESDPTPSTRSPFEPATYMAHTEQSILVQPINDQGKRLLIESVRQEHRGYYICLADNEVTERYKKVVYLRVKDKLAALWPFLGIITEIFILLTIIQIWDARRAYREHNNPASTTTSGKTSRRPASGTSRPHESVPLTQASR